MEQKIELIKAEIERLKENAGIGLTGYSMGHENGVCNTCDNLLDFINSLPEEPSGLDNSKMPVDRWKEACKAACCDRNYRSHYGMTETRDDYFVDGVQWADEHPYKESVSKELEEAAEELYPTTSTDRIGDNYLMSQNTAQLYRREGFKAGAMWQKEMDKKSFILLKEWFEDIQEKSFRLTSGNVSHLGATIRGFAKNCEEYIKTDLL